MPSQSMQTLQRHQLGTVNTSAEQQARGTLGILNLCLPMIKTRRLVACFAIVLSAFDTLLDLSESPMLWLTLLRYDKPACQHAVNAT
jgi:hypothetical protein